ncbi:hypothetical protein J6590_098202 [Homalodisca vitripennis]|nr:hypothetical protein J6590_098202 [Homalodisca vitripennis]
MICGVRLRCSDNRILAILSASCWLSQLPEHISHFTSTMYHPGLVGLVLQCVHAVYDAP